MSVMSDYQLVSWLHTINCYDEVRYSPTTDAADDIVVSLSAVFQLDFVVHKASDAVVPD